MDYFKDETSKIIFYLVEIKGKQQLDFLGISPSHYCNKSIAEKWYRETKKIIAPEHPKATEAMQALENLYKGMK